MGDAIPQADPEFDAFVHSCVDYLTSNAASLGVSAAMATALSAALAAWSAKYGEHLQAQVSARSATAAKKTAKVALVKLLRPAIQLVQSNPAVTATMLRSANLRPRDKTRTRPGVPASRPIVSVDTRQRLQHVIQWRDELTPKSKAKPKGVFAAEIWCYIGSSAPTGLEQFKFVTLNTATPYLLTHATADAGKTAYYNLRWINSHNETGPWSETVSATITG